MGSCTQDPPRLPYGVRRGDLLHISEVPRGLGCGCVCPACLDPLIAKKGQVREHHFAHAAGSDCPTAVETALHLAAKDILAKRMEIVLPTVKIPFLSAGVCRKIKPEQRYSLTSVALEKRLGDITPDVIAHVGDRPLLIEVRVTHGIDDQKLEHIERLGISAVEIDLSAAPRDFLREDLEALVVKGGTHKKWIYNAEVERRRRQMRDRLDQATVRKIRSDRYFIGSYVDGCPIPKSRQYQVWGWSRYSTVEDCAGCKHVLEIDDRQVFCNA